jgi:hypothetical protein
MSKIIVQNAKEKKKSYSQLFNFLDQQIVTH